MRTLLLSVTCLLALSLLLPGMPLLADDEIEELEFVEIEPVVSDSDTISLATLTGRMHPAVIHMPIAWLVLLLLVDFSALLLNRKELLKPGLWLLILTVLSCIPAITTGLINYSSYVSFSSLVETHRNLAITVFGITLVSLILRWRSGNKLEGTVRWIYLFLITVAVLLIGGVGHIGGKLVFGETYLPF